MRMLDVGARGSRPVHQVARLAATGVAALLVTGACTLLDASAPPTPTPRASDQGGPLVVVTVGGAPATTATPEGVAPTIPESTPLPRVEPPPHEAGASATGRPAASPAAASGGTRAATAPRASPATTP